jgi:hypothetical protein
MRRRMDEKKGKWSKRKVLAQKTEARKHLLKKKAIVKNQTGKIIV